MGHGPSWSVCGRAEWSAATPAPPHLRVVPRSILRGLHHEYGLERKVV
jgi:hypothetical protein